MLLSLHGNRFLLRRAAAFVLACVALTASAKAADIISVTLDRATLIQLPEKTATVIIGNPIVADVTMLKRNSRVILTGKGYGETNMIALDASGNSLGESVIRVKAASQDMIVQRGMDRESYSCAPRCQPTVALGDTTRYTADVAGQIQARNALSGTR